MSTEKVTADVIIIGASASGLMCAIEAAKRKRNVIVLDHANKAGKKILMSGGGRCNFTNMNIDASKFISHNPHFCKSALSRYTQWDFIAMVRDHHIPFHERDLGKLFCDDSAKDILGMLLSECHRHGVTINLNCTITSLKKHSARFCVETSLGSFDAQHCVIASGGLSIPKMCASPFGYRIAEQFGLNIKPTHAGLVPFTLQPADKDCFGVLAGISVPARVSNARIAFNEDILFTHRGLSGPAILQISSYWRPGEAIMIDLLPDESLSASLNTARESTPGTRLKKVLNDRLPKRLIRVLFDETTLDKTLQECSRESLGQIADSLHRLAIRPNATEGYRTAEVTLGGVDCDELSSKTMEARRVDGLYFIGEVVDVTGWLGGYNFQWAWSSGWCAGQVV